MGHGAIYRWFSIVDSWAKASPPGPITAYGPVHNEKATATRCTFGQGNAQKCCPYLAGEARTA